MSNVFTVIGHGIEVAAKDVAHAVVDVIEFLPKATAVLASAIKDQPEVKSAVIDLVKQAATVIADLGADAASKGFDLASDEKTLADAEVFFAYFQTTFIPLVEKLYSEVAADLK